MTRQQFQKEHAGDLQKFIQSPLGQQLLNVLGSMRPPYQFPDQQHLLAENRGAMRGYELCLRNMLALTMPFEEIRDAEPTYGVPSKPKTEE